MGDFNITATVRTCIIPFYAFLQAPILKEIKLKIE